jgi:hypothetical protein
VSVMTRKQSAMPSTEMQHQARKLAAQASKLAEQAGPATKQAAKMAQEGARHGARTARQGAGQAAEWARPQVSRARVWMAARAASGSVSVQENVAPKVSSMLATAARRLDPPQTKTRRWPRIMLRTTVLAASAAAIAVVLRARSRSTTDPSSSEPPTGATVARPAPVPDQATESDRPMAESEFNGISRTR